MQIEIKMKKRIDKKGKTKAICFEINDKEEQIMKIAKKLQFLAILIAIVAMLSSVMFSIVFGGSAAIAQAATVDLTLEELTEAYTNSDFLYNGSYTIRAYPNVLYHKYADGLTNSADDPIVDIVPRQYFEEVGIHTYIGREYGFFVNTYNQQYGNSKNNICDVMVFDIITQNDLETTVDQIIVRVESVFQYRYAYVYGDEKYIYTNIDASSPSISEYNIQGQNTCVIPLPESKDKLSGTEYTFAPLTKYYLKDISFAVTLYNEQHLNTFNEGYKAVDDKGSFITSYDYKYDGVYKTYKGIDTTGEKIDIALNSIGFVTGILSNVPIKGIKLLSTAISLATNAVGLIISAVRLNNKNSQEGTCFANVDNGQITVTNYYNTKDGQLAHYVDADGNPQLTKCAVAVIQGDDNAGNVWYGAGDHAECYFRVSNSSDNEADWQTRYGQEVALTIVDEDGKVYQSALGFSDYVINDPVYETVGIGTANDIILLPNGSNYFEITPEYNSRYDFVLDDNYGCEMSVVNAYTSEQQEVTKKDNNFSCYLQKGKKYQIILSCDTGYTSDFAIMPQLANVSVDNPDEEQLFRYECSKDGLYKIFGDKTSRLTKLYRLRPSGLQELPLMNNNLFLEEGTTYFIDMTISQGPSEYKCNVELDDDVLNLNGATYVYSPNAYDFFKFVVPKDGDYYMILECTIPHNVVAFAYYDEYGNYIGAPSEAYSNGYMVMRNLKRGQIYYVGFLSMFEANIYIKQNQAKFTWKVRKGNDWQTIDGQDYAMARGTTETFRLWIDDIQLEMYYTFEAAANLNITVQNNTLTLGADVDYHTTIFMHALDGTPGPLEDAKQYAYFLRITVLYGPADFAYDQNNIDYQNKIAFDVANKNIIHSVHATLSGTKGDDTTFTQDCTFTEVPTDFLDFLYSIKAKTASLTIHTVNAGNDEYNDLYNVNITLPIGCMYVEKENIKFLANKLHLYNLRNSTDALERRLLNDIRVGEYFEPIPELKNNLNGNGHTIIGLKIKVEQYVNGQSEPNWGFVRLNSAVISDLSFSQVVVDHNLPDVPGAYSVGAIAGKNAGTITGCTVQGDLDVKRQNVNLGAIAGLSIGPIINCIYKDGNISGSGDMGGIVGKNYNLVQDCTVQGIVIYFLYIDTARSIGGVCGLSDGGRLENNYVKAIHICVAGDKLVHDFLRIGYLVGNADASVLTKNHGEGSSVNLQLLPSLFRRYVLNGNWQQYGQLKGDTQIIILDDEYIIVP